MDDLRCYIIFNSILVILGHLEGDNERLYAIEPHLLLKRKFEKISVSGGIQIQLASFVAQCLLGSSQIKDLYCKCKFLTVVTSLFVFLPQIC